MERKRILIDTSILIDHLRKKQKDKTIFFELAKQYDCSISSITGFEFSVGSSPQNREFTQKLLSILTVLSFNSACVQIAVDIYGNLKAKNRLISLPDIFIAATAIANSLPLQTLNLKHFMRIGNLKLDLEKS